MDINDDGSISYMPAIGGSGRAMDSLSEANAAIDAFGATKVHNFQSGYTSRWTPTLVRDFQKHMQQRHGGRVELFSFHPDSDAQWESLKDLVVRKDASGRQQMYGWMVPDDETSTLLRAFTPNEKGELVEWTADQLMDEMQKVYGFSAQSFRTDADDLTGIFSSKFYKRAKATVTNKTFEMMSDNPIKVSVIDSSSLQRLGGLESHFERTWDQLDGAQRQQLLDGAKVKDKAGWIRAQMTEAARTGSDGISFGSTGVFRRMLSEQEDLLATLIREQEHASALGKTMDARNLGSEIASLDKDVNRLRTAINSKSGVWNVRLMGGEGRMPVGSLLDSLTPEGREAVQGVFDRMRQEGWQLKGNIMIDDEITRAAGADIVTDFGNIKFEFGFAENVLEEGRGLRSLFTLNPFKHSHSVILDEQTITSNPDVFNASYIKQLTDDTVENFQAAMRSIQDEGVVPSQMRALIEAQVDSPDPIRGQKARNLLSVIDEGYDLRMDPALMEEAMDVVSSSMFSTKNGVARLKIELPQTARGELVPYWTMANRADVREMQAASTLMEGPGPASVYNLPELQFNKATGTFIMTEADSVRFKAAFGGFDFDDAIFSMLRVDPDTGELIGFGIRQPNAAGEFVAFRVAAEDDLVAEQIVRFGTESQQGRYQSLINELSELRQNEGIHNASLIRDREEQLRRIAGEVVIPTDTVSAKIAGGGVPGIRGSVKVPMGDGAFSYMGIKDSITFLDAEMEAKSSGRATLNNLIDHMSRMAEEQGQPFEAPKTVDSLRDQIAILNRHFVNEPRRLSTIGMYINPRMVIDSWIGTHGDALHNIPEVQERLARIRYLETEQLIDIAKDPRRVKKLASNIVEDLFEMQTIARGMGHTDLGIDPVLDELRLASFGDAKERGMERGNRILADMGRDRVGSIEDLYMSADDPRAVFSVMRQAGQQVMDTTEGMKKDLIASEELMGYEAARTRRHSDMAKRVMRAAMYDADDVPSGYAAFAAEMEPSRRVFDVISQTFDSAGHATDDTYNTIIRMQQLSEGNSAYRVALNSLRGVVAVGVGEDGMPFELKGSHGGLLAETQRFLRGEASMHTYGLRDLTGSLEMLTDDMAYRALDEMLEGSSITSRMVKDLDEGIRLTYGDYESMPLSKHAQKIVSADNIFAQNNSIFRPMSMATLIEFEGNQTTLNNLLYRYSNATSEAFRDQVRDAVTRSLTTLRDDLSRVATTDPDIPDLLRDNILRSLERGQDPASREAIQEVNRLMKANQKTTSGGRFTRMTASSVIDAGRQFGYGRLGVGAAAVGAMVAYNRKRNKDYTLNDMQGPEFMPGGNPYSEGFGEALEAAQQRESLQGYSDSGGVTYQVRGRGGSYDNDFVSALEGLSGGPVSGSTYDASVPFAHESARDTILRRYGGRYG